MARSPVRTLVIVLALIAVALLLRWAAGDGVMDGLRSLHGR